MGQLIAEEVWFPFEELTTASGRDGRLATGIDPAAELPPSRGYRPALEGGREGIRTD